MILLDTNVLIYAFESDSAFYGWARETIIDAVTGDGAAINAVSLAEICVGDADPSTVADRIRSWGVEILDVPAAAAEPVQRLTVNIGSGGHLNPSQLSLICRSLTFSSALMRKSWVGRLPLRIATVFARTSLLFRSRRLNDLFRGKMTFVLPSAR